MDSIDDAEAIIARLRDVPPQHATEATVAAYRRAIELLDVAAQYERGRGSRDGSVTIGAHSTMSED